MALLLAVWPSEPSTCAFMNVSAIRAIRRRHLPIHLLQIFVSFPS